MKKDKQNLHTKKLKSTQQVCSEVKLDKEKDTLVRYKNSMKRLKIKILEEQIIIKESGVNDNNNNNNNNINIS